MSKSKPLRRIDIVEMQVSNLSTKVDMFINEMREQNRQRAAEIAALDIKITKMQEQTDAKFEKMQAQTDAKFEKMQAQTDAKFSKIEEKLDDMGKHVRNMAVTAVIGVVAIGAAVIGIAYSVITR